MGLDDRVKARVRACQLPHMLSQLETKETLLDCDGCLIGGVIGGTEAMKQLRRVIGSSAHCERRKSAAENRAATRAMRLPDWAAELLATEARTAQR